MDYVTLLGLTAGALTTLSFAPQALKVWRTKSAGDISLMMYGMICVGIVCWLAYGLLIGSLPIVLANSVTLVITLVILALTLRYR